MATLHMDTEACRAVAAGLMATQGQMEASSTALLNAINTLVGTGWVAPGAVQYQANFQQWQAVVANLLQTLKGMGTGLEAEIQEWEQVTSSF